MNEVNSCIDCMAVTVKASHTRYRALGPAVSPNVTIRHPSSGGLLLLFARPLVTFPAASPPFGRYQVILLGD